jgi:cell wall-associated NlpC family hydrolase
MKSLWTPHRQAAAHEEAQRWLGTPHRNRMAKVGVGIDCLGFVRAILTAAEILPAFEFPYYNPAWGLGRASNIMERVLLACTTVTILPPNAAPDFGDLIIFAVGRQSNHVGIVLSDGAIWHVQTNYAVGPVHPDDDLKGNIQSIARITAPGFHRRPETLTTEDLAPTL